MNRREWSVAALLGAAFSFYVVFDQYGLLGWAQSALGVDVWGMAPLLGCLVVCGALSAVAASRAIVALRPGFAAQIKLIATAQLAEGIVGLLCLAADSRAELLWPLAALGVVQGVHIVLILGLLNSATRPARLGWSAGVAAGIAYLLANLLTAVFPDDPRGLCLAACVLSLVVGLLAALAVEQSLPQVELRELNREPGGRSLIAVLLLVVVLDSALWQVLTSLGGGVALGPQSPRELWLLNGLLHLAAAIVGGLLWPLLGSRRLAALGGLLIGLSAALVAWSPDNAPLWGVLLLQSASVGIYSVALYAAWSELGLRAVGPGIALVGFVGSPLGVGLGMLLGRFPRLGLWLLALCAICVGLGFLIRPTSRSTDR
ncbi:MAG: hypothetical protein P9M14_01640 [Candidatus Alcyoniella australis]|nr:hypothetical protein [Candidatus Alcyoniella australis]